MEAQTIAVAVQMMRAYYIDDHNDSPRKAFAIRVSITEALACKCSFFCTWPIKASKPTEVTEEDCEVVVIGY